MDMFVCQHDDENVVVTYHNPLDNVKDLAHHFFKRCLVSLPLPLPLPLSLSSLCPPSLGFPSSSSLTHRHRYGTHAGCQDRALRGDEEDGVQVAGGLLDHHEGA